MSNVIQFPLTKREPLSDDAALALLREQGEREAAAGVYEPDEPDEWDCKAAWCPTNGSYQCDECMRHDPSSPYYAGGED
jgi:hypothetical protein